MALGIVFSGQGNQYFEMFRKLYEYNPKYVDDLASKLNLELIPKINLSNEELFSNYYAQPLISAYEYLFWQELAPYIEKPVAFGGYSLGEVTALSVSSNIGLDKLLDIVDKRVEFMSASGEGESGLASVSGLGFLDLNPICQKFNCYIAIKNGRDQHIIGGKTDDLKNCVSHLNLVTPPLKLTKLDVSIASHTPILKNAGILFQEYLSRYQDLALSQYLLSGVSAKVCYSADSFIADLGRQLYTTIEFNKVIQVLYELGATTILEIGPGHGLANIIKQYNLPVKVKSIDDFSSISGLITWLNKQ